MKKILFFIERLSFDGKIGGAEKVLCNLANHMDLQKYDITVQTVFPDKASYMLSEDIHYKHIFRQENKLSSLRYRLETALGLTYLFHIRGSYDIEAAYLEFGPTKVMAASTNKEAKKLAWIHCDLETAIVDKEKFRKKSEKYYQAMDNVICVSEKVQKSFCQIFGEKHSTVVLHNIIDDTEIKEKSKEILPEVIKKEMFTILAVGRLSPPKNYIRLLRTVKWLKDDGFAFRLWIVGDGEERKKLEQFIRENKIEDMVTLWGFQRNPYPFMRAADLLVCSSNYEGYSTFVSEGLILEKPILTTDCSGMHELLGDSEYGTIVNNNDDAFYEGLKKILKDPEDQLLKMQKKAQKRSADLRMEKLLEETEVFFDQILSEDI